MLKGSITQLESLTKEDPLLKEEEKFGEEKGEQEDDGFVPPDGGYGWFVSLGAFIALFWTTGLVKSYGVLYTEMITLYPDDISLASWIPAAMTTMMLAMAPVASMLCKRFNCRVVTLLGSLLASAGVALTSLMPGPSTMFLTMGLLTGAGFGLSITPGIILTNRYFDRRRSLANALCLSGTEVGSFTLPVLIRQMLDQYGFRETLLLLGAGLLSVCISAALFRPLATHVSIVHNQNQERKEVRSEFIRTDITAAQEPPTKKFFLHTAHPAEQTGAEEGLQTKGCALVSLLEKYLDVSLVRDPVFLLLAGSVMMMAVGVPHLLFFLPSHAKQIGLPSTDASFLLSISAIFNLVSRLVLGFILDLNLFPKYLAYSLVMMIGGIAAICLPSAWTFSQVAVCMGFYGVGTGGWFLMVTLMLAEYLGAENIASSYGLARLFQASMNLASPIVAGLLLDTPGSPAAGFYLMGASMSLGSLLVHLLPIAARRANRKDVILSPLSN